MDRLAIDLAADGVAYAEVRFAPELHVETGLALTDVVEAVLRAGGPKLDKRLLTLQPIKSLGSHTVTVKVHPEVEATLTVDVVAAS